MSVRALIVDDEPLARQRLRTLLKGESDIELVGECADGQEAVAAIRELQPHLLFLDVQMPVLDGFGVLDVFFLRAEEIDWIEAAGNYLRLHVGSDMHLLRDTMNNLEARLHPDKFLRIHRSTMVNLERVKELQPWFHGDYKVILLDGTELTLSRSYRPKLKSLLGESL